MHLGLGRFAGTDWVRLAEEKDQALPVAGKDPVQPEEGRGPVAVPEDSEEGKAL